MDSQDPVYPRAPYKQNALFTGGPEFKLNACVGRNGGPYNLHAYAGGYFRGARRLAESLAADTLYIDLVVYPLVFCFRHAVELELKHLCEVVPAALGKGTKISMTHKLLDNWESLKAQFQLHREFIQHGEGIELVDHVIHDLVEIDPTGEAFRFPESRKGNKFLQDTSLINVRVLADSLEPVEGAFDSWVGIAEWMIENRTMY